jgi:hypothetical protein
MSLDAPDWERILVTVEAMGDVPDAPDWQRIAVGPGGTPVTGGGGGPSFLGLYSPYYLGVTMDPQGAQNTVGTLGGYHWMMAFVATATGPAHNILLPLNNTGTYTSGTTWAGLYDFGQTTPNTFTLLAQTASGAAATAWDPGGFTSVALSTNPTLTAGQTYAVAVLSNGGTLTTWGYTLGGGGTVRNATSTPFQCFINGGRTTLAPTLAFSAMTGSLRNFLAYVN